MVRDGVEGREVAASNRPTHLNCNMTVPFVVTWSDNEIHVYETSTAHAPLLTYLPEEGDLYDVNALAFSTGYGSTGMWRFAADQRE